MEWKGSWTEKRDFGQDFEGFGVHFLLVCIFQEIWLVGTGKDYRTQAVCENCIKINAFVVPCREEIKETIKVFFKKIMRTYIKKVTQKLFGLCRSIIIIRLNCHTLIAIDNKNWYYLNAIKGLQWFEQL